MMHALDSLVVDPSTAEWLVFSCLSSAACLAASFACFSSFNSIDRTQLRSNERQYIYGVSSTGSIDRYRWRWRWAVRCGGSPRLALFVLQFNSSRSHRIAGRNSYALLGRSLACPLCYCLLPRLCWVRPALAKSMHAAALEQVFFFFFHFDHYKEEIVKINIAAICLQI
ncbi:hypothetical protein U9M48_026028 [Paspalum notatum var. saurae]|uniref:Uncharacterized protein n=1 Tax=Paspalum notatum var. saurae TaxID=547442 RepID=A0AAQ3TS08_PASNO